MRVWGRSIAWMALSSLLGGTATAQLSLPGIFSDGMVLQRETDAPVWGLTAPGERIRVRGSWMGAAVETSADAAGRWRVEIPTPGAGGPHELVVRGPEDVVFADVWVGEVWITAGQSNMQLPLYTSEGGKADNAAADHPRMRFFEVEPLSSMTPLADCEGEWRTCRPWKVGKVSAVGYHFGLQLLNDLDVPIGLINMGWSGTPARAWTSDAALRRRGDFESSLARIDAALDSPETYESLEDRRDAWWIRQGAEDPGMRGEWMAPDLDEAAWRAASAPGLQPPPEMSASGGCVWYRRTVDLPDDWVARKLLLETDPTDCMSLTWFNGQPVGDARTGELARSRRRYVIPARLCREAGNVITVCVVDTGEPTQPGDVRLRTAGPRGGDGLDLTRGWELRLGASMDELGAWPTRHWFNEQSPTALFNGMVAPVVPFAVRGAIWYQGEADVPDHAAYRTLFPDMIRDWREHWGRGDFPFLFVQIAPFDYPGDTGQAALLREAQTQALAVPNTGMVVTMDIGDPGDIHPRNKREVGRRLALWARARTYGRDDVTCSGPSYRSLKVSGDRVRIEFDHAQGLNSGDAPPSYFTIAAEDRVFHPATATVDGEAVVVHSSEVANPVAVRFAWGAADVPNLANGSGLPAGSFRTDTWD